jgi:molybdate transport system substrate-binding protein
MVARFLAILALAVAMFATASSTAIAADRVRLYAAGSLREALNDIVATFAAASGDVVEAKYGASGLLKDEIAGGAPADIFASATMERPQALAAMKRAAPPVLFARNRLCALVRPGLAVTSATLLDDIWYTRYKIY